MKNAIKIGTVLTGLSTYTFYQYEYMTSKVRHDELYFIVTSICMAVFAFLSIEKTDPVFVRCTLVLWGVFFIMVDIIYIKRWILEGDGSSNYYISLCHSAIFTFLYLIYTVVEKYLKRFYRFLTTIINRAAMRVRVIVTNLIVICTNAIIGFSYPVYTIIENYLKRSYNAFFGRK